MLVVWEPILATDWAPPTRMTLSRLPDPRVIQFWDRNHLVSGELRRSLTAHSGAGAPTCCENKGFFWDMAMLFPADQTWRSTLPLPIFWEGPVIKHTETLEKSLRTFIRTSVRTAPGLAPHWPHFFVRKAQTGNNGSHLRGSSAVALPKILDGHLWKSCAISRPFVLGPIETGPLQVDRLDNAYQTFCALCYNSP